MDFLRKILQSRKPPLNRNNHELENMDQQPSWKKISSGPLAGVNFFVSEKWGDMISGKYDDFLFSAIGQHNIDLANKTIWDVGAHIGYHTLAFSRLASEHGKVVAFEPNPYNLERLKLHIQGNPLFTSNIKIFDFALSEADGTHSFRFNKNVDTTKSSGSFLDYGYLPSDRYKKEVFDDFSQMDVQVKKPDSFLTENETYLPDFIKLDIEGAEVRFLRGAHKLISITKPTFVIEVHNIQNMFEISEIFHSNYYKMFLLDDQFNSSSRCYILAKYT